MRHALTPLRLCSSSAAALPEDAAEPAEVPEFETLFRTYVPYVASIALRILGCDADVDDVVQDVFLSAMKGLGQLRQAGAIRSWLATITVRHASRRLRRRRWRSLLGLDDPQVCELPTPGANPEDKALLQRIYVLLGKLPVAEQVAWTLRHIEGEPLESVAGLCGCSLATAKRRVSAAHQALERMLQDD